MAEKEKEKEPQLEEPKAPVAMGAVIVGSHKDGDNWLSDRVAIPAQSKALKDFPNGTVAAIKTLPGGGGIRVVTVDGQKFTVAA